MTNTTTTYTELDHNGSGDGIDSDNADIRFESTTCADCEAVVGGHLADGPYGHEVPRWTQVFRAPDGRLVCEDCIPEDAEVVWLP